MATHFSSRVSRAIAGSRWGAAAIVVIVAAGTALACPFCSAPSLTLTEQLTQADAALLVKWSAATPAKGESAGSTEYKIVDVVRQPDGGKLAKDGLLTLVGYRAGKPEDLALLLGTKGTSAIDWGSPIDVTAASFAYINNSPRPEVAPTQRLRYFVKFLEDPDQMIASDAYGEFANTAYADIVPLASELPRDKLRKWLNDPTVSPSRLGLYGLMLGLCGTTEDAEILSKKITETTQEFRLGIDGVMGGYLLLTTDKGLDVLDETKFKDKKVPFSETYAAMQALRFMWQYGDGKISAERLRASMRLLLDRPELADLVIADLARWKDWSIQDRLMELYGKGEYDIPSIKRAIVRYMLASVKDAPADGSTVGHVTRGQKYLSDLEQTDPKTVAEAKKFFFIK